MVEQSLAPVSMDGSLSVVGNALVSVESPLCTSISNTTHNSVISNSISSILSDTINKQKDVFFRTDFFSPMIKLQGGSEIRWGHGLVEAQAVVAIHQH